VKFLAALDRQQIVRLADFGDLITLFPVVVASELYGVALYG
jgi:hypothetical protein